VPNEFKARNQIATGFEQHSLGGPPHIKMSVRLIIFIITNKGLLTIPGMLSKE
jgi:hypothetical protein